MSTDQESSEKLRTEILADARRKGEEIVVRAMQDGEALLAKAAAEADRIRQELLDQAHAEADRRSALIQATVPVEASRLRALRIETLLESVYKEASERLLAHEGFNYRETVIVLASHAINRMEGSAFVMKLSGSDKALLGEGFVEEIVRGVTRPVSITVVFEHGSAGGGVVVEDGEARQVWDNRLLKRLERMWPELRRQLAVRASLVPAGGQSEGGIQGSEQQLTGQGMHAWHGEQEGKAQAALLVEGSM